MVVLCDEPTYERKSMGNESGAAFVTAIFFFIAAGPADAGLFKCAGEKGRIIYQENACLAGRELRNLETNPATLSVIFGSGGSQGEQGVAHARSVRHDDAAPS